MPDPHDSSPVANLVAEPQSPGEDDGNTSSGPPPKMQNLDPAEGRSRSALVQFATRSRSRVLQRVTFVVAVLVLAATSAIIIQRLAMPGQINANSGGGDVDVRLAEAKENRSGTAKSGPSDGIAQSEPRIIAQQTDSNDSGDTVPLGLQISGDAAGLALEITGLPTGTTLSAGRLMGEERWRIPATEVGNATVRPPAAFSGTLELAVELRRADDTLIDRGVFRLQRRRTPAPALPNASTAEAGISDASATNVMTVSPSTAPDAIHQAEQPPADREELLIGRSQELISEGDVAAGRALLRPAAEAHDARAALALGATYDPIMLVMLQARGVVADVGLAREWYKKASEFGSQEAEERLKLLTSVDGAGVSRSVESTGTAKDKVAPVASATPRKHMIRSPKRTQTPPNDPNGVYVAGQRVGSDPDPSIRAQLLREDAGRELATDGAGHQLLTKPEQPLPGAR